MSYCETVPMGNVFISGWDYKFENPTRIITVFYGVYGVSYDFVKEKYIFFRHSNKYYLL